MQFSNIFTILALAMTATAIPAAGPNAEANVLDARGGDAGNCANNNNGGAHTAVCCNVKGSFLTACVPIASCSSTQTAFCCKTSDLAVSSL